MTAKLEAAFDTWMSTARDVVLSIAGLMAIGASACVIGTIGFLAYERFGIEDAYVESYCNVSRLQGGNCWFTVEKMASGRTCVDVSLTNKYDTSSRSSTTVCSGLVGPMETKNVSYVIDIEKPCGDDFDSCKFDVN